MGSIPSCGSISEKMVVRRSERSGAIPLKTDSSRVPMKALHQFLNMQV